MAPDQTDSERLAIWLQRSLTNALRLSAAAHGMTQRALVEEALRAWLLANPVDGDAIAEQIEKAAQAE